MVRVRCSHCPQVYQVPEAKLGSQATCKKCQHTFTLEMSADETSTPRVKTAATMSLAGDATAMPRKLGHYLLRRKLGAGAMGEVWLAHDESLERDAALKLMSPGIAADPERRQRFEREAKTAARLLHPNTVAVYSFGVEGEHAYLAMELVAGTSLDKVVSSGGPLPWREATRIICDAARGLAAAHEIGLVHRDVKPANLMRTQKGITKVVDFGLARAMASNTQLTQEGSLLGTPAFMAPEQWMGKDVDARSDLYALICTYYFLLTARLPYDAASLPALGYQHRYEPFPDPRQLLTNLPDGVCRVLARGAQKDPAQRFQSGDDLVAELEALLASPEESLVFNSPWANLYSAAGTASPDVVGSAVAPAAAMPAFEVPSLVTSSRPARKQPSQKLQSLLQHPPAWLIAAAGGLGALMLGIVIYVATNNGTIKIELSDPNAKVEVKVDGDQIELAGLAEPLRLSVREHELRVEGSNFETQTKKFTVKRGGNETLTIELVPRVAVGEPGIRPPAGGSSSATPPAVARTTLAPADARQLSGHHYKFFPELLTWKEAQAKCEAAGGHLVTIESAAEQQFVSNLVAATAWQDSWIGITDEAQEGTWLTVMGQPLRYTNWFANQPNNKGAGEHYGLFSGRSLGQDLAWRWSDQPNEAQAVHQPGYLCEWEPAAADASSSGWISLFNGQDLTGWKKHPADTAQWEVVGGILRGSGGRGQLFTERDDYENFHFRVEAQINDMGNSGQYFRTVFGPNFPLGYEAQISTAQPDQKTGSLYNFVRIPQQLHKPDEWFTQEVVANGNHITISVNGKQVVDFQDPNNTYTRGNLALQQNTAGASVQFRKVEVKVIGKENQQSAAPPQLVPLSELNTPEIQLAPWVSADGLRIYWENATPGTEPTIWQAERSSPSEPFRGSRQIAQGRQPTLTPDELQLICLRKSPASFKSVHMVTRASIKDAFPANSGQELTQFGDFTCNNPCLSADGLALFLNAHTGQPLTGTKYLVSRRLNLQAPWSSPTALDVKWDAAAQGMPLTWLWMSLDELSFLATHEHDIGRYRIVRFTRTAKTEPFETFTYVALPGIDPIRGKSPRYIPATGELFLTALPHYDASATLAGWQAAQPDLWVIRNVRL